MKLFIEICVILIIITWLVCLSVFFYIYKIEVNNKFKVIADAMYVDITEKKFNEINRFPPDELMDAEAYRYIIYHYRKQVGMR